jgi:hypothetical protein
MGFVLERPNTRSNAWRIIVTEQNSAQDCSEFTHRVPEAVLREFHIKGVRPSSGSFGQC